MAGIEYPTHLMAILDKPAFLVAVDRIADLVIENTPDDDTRLAELMIQLTTLCLDQAKQAVKSAYTEKELSTSSEKFFRIIQMADSRWDMTRKYLQDTRKLEAHPLAMISLIQGSTVQDPQYRTELDHVVLDALDRYVEHTKNEIQEAMGWSEDDRVKTVQLPSIKNDSELLMQFFTAFKELGVVHRRRSEYTSEEQKQAYDKLMAIFAALSE